MIYETESKRVTEWIYVLARVPGLNEIWNDGRKVFCSAGSRPFRWWWWQRLDWGLVLLVLALPGPILGPSGPAARRIDHYRRAAALRYSGRTDGTEKITMNPENSLLPSAVLHHPW